MKEKVLSNKKNGMFWLVLISLFYIVGIAVFVYGAILIETSVEILPIVALVIGGIWLWLTKIVDYIWVLEHIK